jgi:hypothetical protein
MALSKRSRPPPLKIFAYHRIVFDVM